MGGSEVGRQRHDSYRGDGYNNKNNGEGNTGIRFDFDDGDNAPAPGLHKDELIAAHNNAPTEKTTNMCCLYHGMKLQIHNTWQPVVELFYVSSI